MVRNALIVRRVDSLGEVIVNAINFPGWTGTDGVNFEFERACRLLSRKYLKTQLALQEPQTRVNLNIRIPSWDIDVRNLPVTM